MPENSRWDLIQRLKGKINPPWNTNSVPNVLFVGMWGRHLAVEIAALATQSFPHHWLLPSGTPIGEFRMSFKQLYIRGYLTEYTSNNHRLHEIVRM